MNCLACHGKAGADGHIGPNLQESEAARDLDKIIKQVKNGGTAMPAFGDLLTKEQVQHVAAYVHELIKTADQ